MRHKGLLAFGFLLIQLITYQITDARKCNINCAGTTGNLLKFLPGKAYNYKLEGSSKTTLPGTKNNVSKVAIEANVEISAEKGCEHVLIVSGVKSIGPNGKKYNLDKTLGSNGIKFGLQNGKLVELCAVESDMPNALNIKRAILSLIQTTVLKESGYATQHETDIFGSCPTNFEFVKIGGGTIVKKSKDLTKCAHREELNLPFGTTSYYINSDIQSLPLLTGSLHTEQKLEGGILKSAVAEEEYIYNPLSRVEPAARVKVVTQLTFTGHNDKPCPVVPATSGESIIYRDHHPDEYKGGLEGMMEILKGSCDSRTVGEDGASKFSTLVRLMANAPKGELINLYQKVKSGQGFKEKDIAKKMYLDAIVQADSSSSVEVMAELLKKKEVTGSKATLYYLLLAGVKHASKESLVAVAPLLEGNEHVEAYLGAGALGGRYCQEHDCTKYSEVGTFQNKLAGPLLTKGCKPATKKEEDILLASLKGLENMRFLTKPVVEKLISNVIDKDVKTRVRVAILETMRSDANKPEFKKVAGEIFKDTEEDSEIRIKAYLVLAQCPCGKVAALVKDVLEHERSYQVGSFVTSHLRNLRASTNPEKANAKHHLGGIMATDKFPINFRKYSQNFELSNNVDMLNIGAAGESNVIYSQKSYIPRSLSLNLTSFLFGHAVNWLELDIRTEHLEKEIEKIFGPRGLLRKNKYNEVYDDGREYVTSLLEKTAERYEKSIRPKRSVSRNDLNTLAHNVNLHHEAEDDLDIDVSMKMFGAELFWLRFHGNEDTMDADKVIDKFFGQVDESLNSIKDLNFDYRKHFSFLDEEIIYPTGLGLPLKLKTIGSTAYRVKVDGKFDIPALLRDPMNTDIRLQLIPSAAVEVRSDIAIDGIAFEGGVKVSLNMHTSTGSDITFRVIDGKGVDIKFGLPIKKQDILTVKTDISTVIKENTKVEQLIPIEFDTKRETYSGCYDQLNEILGLTVCGEVDVPWDGERSLLPSNGPAKLSLHLDKADDSLTSYHFKVYGNEHEDVNSIEVLFDTPNSKENRKMALKVEGSLEKKFLKFNLNTPWTTALFDGALVYTPKEASLKAKFVHDSAEYYLRTGATKSQQGNVIKYEPILEYKAPEQAKSALVGRRGGPKLSSQVITVSGAVLLEKSDAGEKLTFENLAVVTPRTKYSIDGTGNIKKQGGDLDVVVHYDNEHVKIKGELNENGPHLKTQLIVLPSQYPDFGLNIKWDALNDEKNNKYESKLILVHGPDQNSETSKIYLHNKLEINSKSGIFDTDNKVTYPVFNLDGHIGLRITPKSFKTDLKGKFDEYSAAFFAKGEVNTKKEGDYNAEIRWDLMGNSVALTTARKILKNHQSKFLNSLEIKPGGKYELNVLATHKWAENDVDLVADVDVILPAEPKNMKLKVGLKDTLAETKGHLNAVAGDKHYLLSDFSLKTKDHPSGTYKLKMLDYINSNGDFVFDGNNFKGKAKIDLPKIERQMEGKANFLITETKFSGNLDICWDLKTPEKTLKIQTDTTLHANSYESKNSVLLGDKKTVLNLKGLTSGEDEKGSSAGEIELILPDKHHITLTLKESRDVTDEKNMHGETILELSHLAPDESSPCKATVKLVGKNIDLESLKYDGQLVLSYVSSDKKDLHTHIILKKTPKDSDKWLLKTELAASGTLIQHPITFSIDSEVSNDIFEDDSLELDSLPTASYHTVLSVGSDIHIEGNSKMGGKSLTGDFNAKLPSGPVKSLKFTTSNILDIFNDESKPKKIKSNNELHWNGENFVKFNGEANCEHNGLNYVTEWESNKLPKRKLSGSAHWSEEANSRKADVNAAFSAEGKSVSDLSLKMERTGDVGTLHLIGKTPELGKIDLLIQNKIVKDGRGLHSEIILITKDKKVSGSTKIELVENHPLIEFVIDHPDGKSRLLIKSDSKGDRHWTGEIKAKWSGEKSGSLSADSELFLKSIDNFYIKHNIDSPQLGVRKLHVDLSNKPGRGDGKKITVTVKSDDKLIISGSSNYVVKEDNGVKHIEGNGNVKVQEKQYPVNFKGSWEELDNGHRAAKLNVKTGKASVSVEYKDLENEFVFVRQFCQNNKCSKSLFINKVKASSLDEFEYVFAFGLDLHLISPELKDFSYEASYKRKGQQLDHLIESKWGDDVKFKYNGFIHKNEAGLLVTVPKHRTVGTEIKYDIKNDEHTASGLLEFDVWLNKEKHDKLCFVAKSNVDHADKNNIKVSGEAKVTHPLLKKDLAITGHYTVKDQKNVDGGLILDIFNYDQQKIKITYKKNVEKLEDNKKLVADVSMHITSEDCKLDLTYTGHINVDEKKLNWEEKISYLSSTGNRRETIFKYNIEDKKKVYLLVKLPSTTLVEADVSMKKDNKDVELLGNYIIDRSKFKELLNYNFDNNRAVYNFVWGPHSFDAEFGILMGKGADFKIVQDSKTALDINVALDETNFLKTNYHYDPDVAKNSWESWAKLGTDVVGLFREPLKNYLDEEQKEYQHIYECMLKCTPDLAGVANHFTDELEQMKKEILEDKDVSEAINHLKEGFGKLFEHLQVFCDELNNFVKIVTDLVQDLSTKVKEVLDKVLPELSDALDKFAKTLMSLLEQYVKALMQSLEKINDELKKYKEDFDAYIKVLTDATHDIGKQFAKIALAINEELQKFVELNLEQLRELPIMNMLKEKFEELKDLKVPDEAVIVFQELVANIQQFLPTPECEDFVSTLSDYITKILKQEPVDNAEVGKELYEKLVNALKSLLSKLNEAAPTKTAFEPAKFVSLPIVSLLKLPTGSVRCSLWNLITSPDFPIFLTSFETFAPSLNPIDEIPPFKGISQIIDNTEIITFDGRHYSINGLCSYVLAEDYVDRNFSIVGNFKDGKLEAITIWDDAHSVTLRKDGAPLKDGGEVEYPIAIGLMKAWKTPSMVGVKSKSGVSIECSATLESCTVLVSGFYFGKLRGLFGNLNYEQYDDLNLPEGKIDTDTAHFCNSWKVEKSCPDIPAVPHTHKRESICTEMFTTEESDLVLGRPWLPMEPYRDACDHLVERAHDKKAAACKVAASYVFHAQEKGAFLVDMPDDCIVCDINGKKVTEDESTIVAPANVADIIFIVDVLKENQETYKNYIQPLVPELKKELQKNGISDVHVTLMSYNSPTFGRPKYHTVNGKIEFNGHDCIVEFEEEPVKLNHTFIDKLLLVKDELLEEIGYTQRSKAYSKILDSHLFRPNALKTIIGVHSEPCVGSSVFNFILPVKVYIFGFLTEDQGIVTNLITPISGLTTDRKDEVNNNDIIGFTEDHTYTMSKGEVDCETEYDSDFCIDAAHLTGGAVFPSNNFHHFNSEGKGDVFIQKTAEKIVKTMVDNKKSLECECTTVNGIIMRPDCEIE